MTSGTLFSSVFFYREKFTIRIITGITFGIAFMIWFPALTSFIFGFNVFSQITAVLISSAFCLLFYSINKNKVFNYHLYKNDYIIILILIPLMIFTYVILRSNILNISDTHSLTSGQSTYGDMPMHLGFITSISSQQIFPPNYNLIGSRTSLGYPFLSSSVSSTLYTLGASLTFSYIAPMLFAFFTVYTSVFILFESVLISIKKTIFAFTTFFVGGGFGFVYFIDNSKSNNLQFSDIFKGFYLTPMNLTDNNIRWVNIIADMLIPQRSTLFGYAILFPCIFILYKAVFEDKKLYFIPLALLAGMLPLINTHSFLALGMLSFIYLLFCLYEVINKKRSKDIIFYWLIYGCLTLILALPQLINFTLVQASTENFIRFHFNWANSGDNYFWFYIKNLGLLYILIIPSFIHAGKKHRILYLGGVFILLVSEFIVFQPNEYDNNKLLFIWFLLSCGLVANYLIDVYDNSNKKETVFIMIIIIILFNISGLLTLAREFVSTYDLFSRDHVQASNFIIENTENNSLFLTANNHNNSVASLTGRTILAGSEIYLYFHGIDYSDYQILAEDLFNYPTLHKLKSSKIDYVFVSEFEHRAYPHIDINFFESNLLLIYDNNNNIKIFKVPK